MEKKIDIIIPIYKPNNEFLDVIEKLQNQTVKPNKIILMNTEERYAKAFLEESKILEKYDNIEIHHVSEITGRPETWVCSVQRHRSFCV